MVKPITTSVILLASAAITIQSQASIPDDFANVAFPTPTVEYPAIKTRRDISHTVPAGFTLQKGEIAKIQTPTVSKSIVKRLSETKSGALDSILRFDGNGSPLSRVRFTYSDAGLPSMKTEETISNGKWSISAQEWYEYDALSRVAMHEVASTAKTEDNYKYEYEYVGNGDQMSQQTFYSYNEVLKKLLPSQRASYEYDSSDRLTKQVFYAWNGSAWVAVYKTEIGYDNLGRPENQYNYAYNTASDSWGGINEVGQWSWSVIYDNEGRVKQLTKYFWENNSWRNLVRYIYTYDSNDRLSHEEYLVWNPVLQDWRGCYAGEYNTQDFNFYVDISYDVQGRVLSQQVYRCYNTENYYIHDGGDNYTWTELENDCTEVNLLQTVLLDINSIPEPYMRTTQRFNKHNSEYYYYRAMWQNDEEVPVEMEMRDIDDYNIFHGGSYYGYNSAGQRYGKAKEEFFFAEDFNPALGLFTPVEAIQYSGASIYSDDSWNPNSAYTYEWEGNVPQMITKWAYTNNKTRVRLEEAIRDVDFNLTAENTSFWPGTISQYGYGFTRVVYNYNPNFSLGVDSWAKDQCTEEFYYYSGSGSGVDEVAAETDVDRIEIARYDISGRKVPDSYKGIVIIRYNDGTSKKTVVK